MLGRVGQDVGILRSAKPRVAPPGVNSMAGLTPQNAGDDVLVEVVVGQEAGSAHGLLGAPDCRSLRSRATTGLACRSLRARCCYLGGGLVSWPNGG